MPVQPTDIVWTDYSGNLWVGCAKVSEGCRWCWAADMAGRFDRTPEPWTIANLEVNFSVYDDDMVDELASLSPGWCFYPSSSDPFLPVIDDATRMQYMESIFVNDHICFQVLTKWGPEVERSEQDAMPDDYEPEAPDVRWPANVMLGVSCESPLRTYRLDWLRQQDAETKFVSFEPLVEDVGAVDLSGIDWIIVGGESHRKGDERREMEPEWAVSLYEQARAQDVAFLFKQHSGAFAEQDRRLGVPGQSRREFNGFPPTPDGLPDAPRDYLGDQPDRECLTCGYVSQNDEIQETETAGANAVLKDYCPECGSRYADRGGR